MQTELAYISSAIAAMLFITGLAYAVLMYHAPAPHGLTYISVIVGVAFTVLGIMFATFVWLVYAEALYLWPLILIPPVSFGLTGGPMIVGQVIKKRNEDKFKDSLKGRYEKTPSNVAE